MRPPELEAARRVADDLAMLARLTRDVPPYLRRPIGAAEARARVRHHLAIRERRFLAVVERAIYRRPGSPYARLLRHVGCELGDLRALVAGDGLESALRRLAADGVYLTYDELKGSREAARGSARFRFREEEFDNPLVPPHLLLYTGGTGGRPSRVWRSLETCAEAAESASLFLDAHGVHDPELLIWSASPAHWMLSYAKLGQRIAAWFYPLRALSRRAWLGARYLSGLARLAGHRFPLPIVQPLEQPEPVVSWLSKRLGDRRQFVVFTVASSATRLAIAAQAAGVSLEGVTFHARSEPVTEARRRQIEATGAQVIVDYGSMEIPFVGFSCATPRAADDVHLFEDRHALVERTREVYPGGPAVDALLLSSLSPWAGKIYLNAETGDDARVERRACRCSLDALGLRTHLSAIRSFEKLTGEGVTFARANLDRILEEALPGLFGGTALDYQVVEEEADDGAARLVLRVSPAVGELDEAAVRAALLRELGRDGPVESHMAAVWRQAGTVRLSREPPIVTGSGKMFPFQPAGRAEGRGRDG